LHSASKPIIGTRWGKTRQCKRSLDTVELERGNAEVRQAADTAAFAASFGALKPVRPPRRHLPHEYAPCLRYRIQRHHIIKVLVRHLVLVVYPRIVEGVQQIAGAGRIAEVDGIPIVIAGDDRVGPAALLEIAKHAFGVAVDGRFDGGDAVGPRIDDIGLFSVKALEIRRVAAKRAYRRHAEVGGEVGKVHRDASAVGLVDESRVGRDAQVADDDGI